MLGLSAGSMVFDRSFKRYLDGKCTLRELTAKKIPINICDLALNTFVGRQHQQLDIGNILLLFSSLIQVI